MNRFLFGAFLSLIGLGLLVGSASADLIGATVTGEIYFGGGSTNYFDPANGFVPPGYLNTSSPTVIIGEPAIEFGFLDGADRDTANFTGNQLIVSDEVFSAASDWTMKFTSAAFSSLVISEISDSFPNGGVTGTKIGNTINLNWAGVGSPVGLLTVTFSVVPEPTSASLALLGGIMVLARRRSRK